MEGERWNDFDVVTSRLNRPELIDYWEKMNLTYEYYRGDRKSNRAIFESKRGNCYDISDFTVYCLNIAGYSAGLEWVESSNDSFGHIITIFEDEGKDFIMDNGKGMPLGIIGPIKSLSEAGYTRQGHL